MDKSLEFRLVRIVYDFACPKVIICGPLFLILYLARWRAISRTPGYQVVAASYARFCAWEVKK
ncbi:MAG TPA: hypothetical protein DEF89_03395 [Desulfosporosinus sp.]|nr:MAG: hypothetical protein JL57_00385 [Desulfosporosinus sp. BICA1-9]HBW34447.1 hypothetical protein [Desulfosporosinus sp.]